MARRRMHTVPQAAGAVFTKKARRDPVASPKVADNTRISFRFNQLDLHGEWAFKKTVKGDHVWAVFSALKKLEGMTVEQAQAVDLLADYDMKDCPNKNATKRLAKQYDGQDALCRINVSGNKKGRKLFGIRTESVISLIWYDTHHSVWPSGS